MSNEIPKMVNVVWLDTNECSMSTWQSKEELLDSKFCTVDSLGSLTLFELDSNENVVNWDVEFEYSTNEGGLKSSQRVGLNETEWKQIQVKK